MRKKQIYTLIMKYISNIEGVNYRKFVETMDFMLKSVVTTTTQNEQMQILFKYEKQFQDILISTEKGQHLYEQFISYIVDECQNILNSRIFFRERQATISDQIFPLIKAGNYKGLQKFRINFYFVTWILKNYPHKPRKDLLDLKDKIVQTRQLVLQESLPSVIHAVKTFTDKFEYSNLEYMDFIQAATEGFLSAIDQYEPPYKKNFGAVVVYRMKLFMMEAHNEPFLKIEQQNKRVLYRIRKAQNEMRIEDMNEKDIKRIQKYVNQSFKGKTVKDIKHLVSSANLVNFHDIFESDITVEGEMIHETTPESYMIKNNMLNSLVRSWKDLTLFEQKLLLLKFGHLDFLH